MGISEQHTANSGDESLMPHMLSNRKRERIARHVARIRFNQKRIAFCIKMIKRHQKFIERLGGDPDAIRY